MCNFDLFSEDRLIWTRTRSQIIHRWELFAEWDMVSRIAKLFGGGEKRNKNTQIALRKKYNEINDDMSLSSVLRIGSKVGQVNE